MMYDNLIWSPIRIADDVRSLREGVRPIDYRLVSPEEAASELLAALRGVSNLSGDLRARPVSGIVELELNALPEQYYPFEQQLLELDEINDRRAFSKPLDHERKTHVLVGDRRSAIRNYSRNVPVIGPGGRIVAFGRGDQPRRLSVDVVIRKREKEIEGTWRDPEVFLALRETGWLMMEAVTVRAAFSYFEASKHERQELLRLVYAFLIEADPERADGSTWRRFFLEPATRPNGLSEWADLEDRMPGLPWRR
jgi:hypothetical protein